MDAINQPLLEGTYSIWNLAAGAAQSLHVLEAENAELSGQWALNGLAVHHNLLYTVKQTEAKVECANCVQCC